MVARPSRVSPESLARPSSLDLDLDLDLEEELDLEGRGIRI